MELNKYSGRFVLRSNLFFAILLFIWVLVLGFTFFQYYNERTFKVELLNTSLQNVNMDIADGLEKNIPPQQLFAETVGKKEYKNLRLTVTDLQGKVLYDSHNLVNPENHKNRPEISKALKFGSAYTIRRLSASTSQEYFYSARRGSSYIVRSALPYTSVLDISLGAGRYFVMFAIIVTLLLSIIGYSTFENVSNGQQEIENQRARALYEELEKVRIKKQLTNNINHELKTPVSAIKACLETLIANPSLDAGNRKIFLDRSYAQVERLTNLLQDVATVTRMDEAPDLIKKEQVSLRDIIAEVISETAQMAENANITVHCIDFKNNVFDMYGNEGLLHSVFRNLIDNAISYSGCSDVFICYLGTVNDEGNRAYYFSFADNGSGVDNEHLSHLFERFYRIDKGRSRKMGGTGLGLSIVRNAVMIHGGKIEVINRVGGGLEFQFSFKVIS